MDDNDLARLIHQKIQQAGDAGEDSSFTKYRQKATRLYRGEPLGNEVEGRSQVVSRDVQDAIDALMPQLMRVFAAGESVVKFDARGPEDEAMAGQATDYVNFLWNSRCDGFRVFHEWFMDALLYRIGVVKVWWEKQEKIVREDFKGLSAEQVETLLSESGVELIGDAMPDEMGMFAVSIRRRKEVGCVKVAVVPPEEFGIDPTATDENDARFIYHRTSKTITELLEMGFDEDKVKDLPSDDDDGLDPEKIERRSRDTSAVFANTSQAVDESERFVTLTESYIYVDYDGDGKAELRKVFSAGSAEQVILENEEVEDNPFATLCPWPFPHQFRGDSVADKLEDIQVVKSTLWRQMLDNLYLTNNPEKEVVADQVNMDDLLSSRPGGIKRVKTPNAIREIATPFTAGASLPMMEFIDQVKEQRTGVNRLAQGLDVNSINKTATGVQLMQNAGAQRPELIARIFAETGVKRAFRLILKNIVKYQDAPDMIRLRNKWVPMDPRHWNTEMDVSVTVGIGTGNREQQVAQLQGLLQLDQLIIQFQGGANGPLVTLPNIYAKLRKMIEAMGLKDVTPYYTDPAQAQMAPPEPPPPDPELIKIEIDKQLKERDQQIREMEVTGKLQLDAQRLQIEAQKAGAEIAVKREQIEHDKSVFSTNREDMLMDKRGEFEKVFVEQNGNMLFERLDTAFATVMQQLQAQQAQVAQSNAMMAQALERLAAAMMAPKEIVRDEKGRPVGARTVLQ